MLIRKVKIVHPLSPLNGQILDIRFHENTILEIGKDLVFEKEEEVIDEAGLCIAPGFTDMFAHVGELGLEQRETFETAASAAKAGGYTQMLCLPNTKPALDSKTGILMVKNIQNRYGVKFLPCGALTKGCEGTEPAEIYDMQAAGAVAFSDGKNNIQNAGVMLRSLQYVKPLDVVMLHQPLESSISKGGQVHEGTTSVMLGMKGIPAIAEELMLRRDLYLLEYTDSRLHIPNVSSEGSLALIREAKAKGLKVTASVNMMNLYYTDSDTMEFDTNFKVMPPLRSETDRDALIEALADGTLDCIVSNHTPLEEDVKNLEFPYAAFGTIGLETTFSAAHTLLKNKLSIDKIVELLSINPRNILKISIPQLEKGETGDWTIFNTSTEWVYEKKDIKSLSFNTPFVGSKFVGKVKTVISD